MKLFSHPSWRGSDRKKATERQPVLSTTSRFRHLTADFDFFFFFFFLAIRRFLLVIFFFFSKSLSFRFDFWRIVEKFESLCGYNGRCNWFVWRPGTIYFFVETFLEGFRGEDEEKKKKKKSEEKFRDNSWFNIRLINVYSKKKRKQRRLINEDWSFRRKRWKTFAEYISVKI